MGRMVEETRVRGTTKKKEEGWSKLVYIYILHTYSIMTDLHATVVNSFVF